jgi:hypothetical protein
MNPLSSLITAACALLCTAGLTAQEPAVLPLDKRPTYHTLTAAGFKLLNPDAKYGSPLEATSYRTEPCRFLLGMGEARSAPLELKNNGGAGFQKNELSPPGTHYPPALPVQDATPIKSLSFDCTYPDLATARAALASMEKMFKIDMPKVDAWIEHKLWESASVLKLTATVPDAEAQIQLLYQEEDQARGQQAACRLIFHFGWNAPPPPGGQPGGARRPRERMLPPNPQTQLAPPAQPPAPPR